MKKAKELTGHQTVPQAISFEMLPEKKADRFADKGARTHLHLHLPQLQVFVDGRLLGGFSEIAKLLDSGELQDLLRNARQPALPQILRNLVQEPSSAPMVSASFSSGNVNFTMQRRMYLE